MVRWRSDRYRDGSTITTTNVRGCTASVATSDHFKPGSRGRGRGKYTWVVVGFGYKPKVKRGKAATLTAGKQKAEKTLRKVCRR